MRRLLFVKDAFYITRGNMENTVIDVVPLSEIQDVGGMSIYENEKMKSAATSSSFQRSRTKMMQTFGLNSPECSDHEEARTGDVYSRICQELAGKGLKNSVFQINTIPDGINFGRVYYFQAGSEQRCQAILSEISALIKAARKRADRSSKWKKVQDFVRSIQTAFPFQLAMVALILMVRSTPHTRRSRRLCPGSRPAEQRQLARCKRPQNMSPLLEPRPAVVARACPSSPVSSAARSRRAERRRPRRRTSPSTPPSPR